jgi:hypothetical protein
VKRLIGLWYLERRDTSEDESNGLLLRRTTGALFLIGALSFATAATILSATFDWPDILREPADVVLDRFAQGGPSLVWSWFATAWTYAILIVPILLLPIALGRRDDAALWVASSRSCFDRRLGPSDTRFSQVRAQDAGLR